MICTYMKDKAPNREELQVYGLMPPCFYATTHFLPATGTGTITITLRIRSAFVILQTR